MNPVSALVGVGCLLGATVLGACGTGAAIPDVPEINAIALQRRVVVPKDLSKWTPILEVDASPELAELRIVSREGIRWIDASGSLLRKLDFSVDVGHGAAVRTLRVGDVQTWAVFDPGPNRLSFFDGDGRLIQSHSCRNCWELVAADPEGSGRQLVVAKSVGASTASSFSARGVPGPTYQADGALAFMAAARIEGEPADSLFFYTERDSLPKDAVRVVRGDGSERARWSLSAGRAIAVSPSGGGAATVVAIAGDTLTEHDALTGAELWRAVVPSSSRFKWAHAGRWRDGRRVLVLTGGASVDRHMVVVADGGGTLLYRETVESRAYDLNIPSPTANGFCIGTVGRVACYEVSGTR